MIEENQTVVTEFILVGLSQHRMTKLLLFALFFIVYLLTIFGNVLLIIIVLVNSRMHTPMYYFLCHLSFLDFSYSTCTSPKMLMDLLIIGHGRISFIGCIVQMNIGLFLGETECLLLVVMAYDRYIAICLPLRYMVIMSWRRCKNITVIVWSGCFISSVLPSIYNQHGVCKGNVVNHFACEVLALLDRACGDMSYDKMKIRSVSLFTLLAPFSLIVVSYMCIIRSVLKIHSVDGRMKAFSTCVSHLTVVIIFYGTSMTLYLGQAKHFTTKHKITSVFYGVVTPMLNPMIYSLRNNEVKGAFWKIIKNEKRFQRKTVIRLFTHSLPKYTYLCNEKCIYKKHVDNGIKNTQQGIVFKNLL